MKEMMIKPKGMSITTKTISMTPDEEMGGIGDLLKMLMGDMESPVKKRMMGLKAMSAKKEKPDMEEEEEEEYA